MHSCFWHRSTGASRICRGRSSGSCTGSRTSTWSIGTRVVVSASTRVSRSKSCVPAGCLETPIMCVFFVHRGFPSGPCCSSCAVPSSRRCCGPFAASPSSAPTAARWVLPAGRRPPHQPQNHPLPRLRGRSGPKEADLRHGARRKRRLLLLPLLPPLLLLPLLPPLLLLPHPPHPLLHHLLHHLHLLLPPPPPLHPLLLLRFRRLG